MKMSSIKPKDREKLNFENLHKKPSETLTNYIIRRQRVYFKAFPGGGGYDPIAKHIWDTAIGPGPRSETSSVQSWKQADEIRKAFECWQ